MSYDDLSFPPFSLSRLLQTVFAPKPGERVAVLIDLENPAEVKDFSYLSNPKYSVQKYAHEVFYKGLHNGVMDELNLVGGDIFAYKITLGSNLDLPNEAYALDGSAVTFSENILPKYDIILCISTYSATAPLTAWAKQYGFRGATLHGVNEIILKSGLSVDYNEVSRKAENFRQAMTRAEAVEIDFAVNERTCTIRVELDEQEAQKSHGICRISPDIANLPAGEVYFVPTGAEGEFPFKFDDGTIAILKVSGGKIYDGDFVSGNKSTLNERLERIKSDPAMGELGELGFGTQKLPASGRDIQDEKILGTFHLATGRSDHLGGDITPDLFNNPINASHDDILFSPTKTPEIKAPAVRLIKNGETKTIITNYNVADFIDKLVS